MKIILGFISFIFSGMTFAATTLNVYTFADYMPRAIIQKFEAETGIKVNYSEYDSNETMYSKLKSNPRTGYDVIFPSSYFIDRMRKEDMLLQLDKTKLSNFHHLSKSFLSQPFDPNNDYSVPYLWGVTGIVINKNHIDPNQAQKWSDFWNSKYQNRLLLFDDVREVFAIALLTLGYSVNETNPEHLQEAFLKLKKLLPNIKLFNTEAQQNIYIDEDAVIGMGFNGDIFNAKFENPNLDFIYPKEGFEMWMDCIAIHKHAPHVEAAYQFINFLLRPEIAKQIASTLGYSTPNGSALILLPSSYRNNPIINPSPEILKRGQILMDLGETNRIYEEYWNKLKMGG